MRHAVKSVGEFGVCRQQGSPLWSGDGCSERLSVSDTSLVHHVIPRIKVLSVLRRCQLEPFSTAAAQTFCILVNKFLAGTLPYSLKAFCSCSVIDCTVSQALEVVTRMTYRNVDLVLRNRRSHVSNVSRLDTDEANGERVARTSQMTSMRQGSSGGYD